MEPAPADALQEEKHQLLAQRNKKADPADYLLVRILRHVDYELRRDTLLVERGCTVRELARRTLSLVRRAAQDKDKRSLAEVFLTLDADGCQAPGRLDGAVGDLLVDGQPLHLTYYRYENMCWGYSSFSLEADRCGLCDQPLGRQRFMTIATPFEHIVACAGCLAHLDTATEKRPGWLCCNRCGSPDAVLDIYKGTPVYLYGRCRAKCNPPKHRECSYCGLPLRKRRLCSRCKDRGYCSTTCQRKDWPEHKPLCRPA